MSNPLILSIEGNIGAGKSTIIEKLKEYMGDVHGILFLKEPLDIWEGVKESATGENILQKFYGNPEKYAFSFQVMAYASRLSMIRDAIERHEPAVIICERSLEADKHIFAQMLHDEGTIDDVNFQIYNMFYKEFSEKYQLNGVIYIDADADVCHKRVETRSREGESKISLEYLQKCKDYHDAWLLQSGDMNFYDQYVLRIDTNANATYEAGDIGMEWLDRIKQFIMEKCKDREEHEEWKRR